MNNEIWNRNVKEMDLENPQVWPIEERVYTCRRLNVNPSPPGMCWGSLDETTHELIKESSNDYALWMWEL